LLKLWSRRSGGESRFTSWSTRAEKTTNYSAIRFLANASISLKIHAADDIDHNKVMAIETEGSIGSLRLVYSYGSWTS
jgi:hypothetical protein